MAKKTSAKKSTRRGGGPRELITPQKGASRYQRRKDDGQFGPADLVSRSLPADRRKKAKKTVKPGFGDLGDQRSRTRRKSSKK